jgi:uncharacterized protein YggE
MDEAKDMPFMWVKAQGIFMKYIVIALILIYPLALFASVPNSRHIVTEGKAQISAAPDIAIVTFETESKQDSSFAAKKNVDRRINDFLEGLEGFGIDEKNVSASSILTSPNYYYDDDDKKVLDGYVASRTIKITLKQIEKLNDLLNFALEVKVNEIRDIEFQSSRKEVLKEEAFANAVEDAKRKGRAMASAFDAKLGKVYSINSVNQHQRHRYGFNGSIERIEVTGSRLEADEFEPGRYLQENIVFSASVDVVFDLEI